MVGYQVAESNQAVNTGGTRRNAVTNARAGYAGVVEGAKFAIIACIAVGTVLVYPSRNCIANHLVALAVGGRGIWCATAGCGIDTCVGNCACIVVGACVRSIEYILTHGFVVDNYAAVGRTRKIIVAYCKQTRVEQGSSYKQRSTVALRASSGLRQVGAGNLVVCILLPDTARWNRQYAGIDIHRGAAYVASDREIDSTFIGAQIAARVIVARLCGMTAGIEILEDVPVAVGQ